MFNLDAQDIAQAGYFLSNYLEQKIPMAIKRRYPALPFDAGILLPQTADLDVGAEAIVAEVVNERGEAIFATGNMNDIPFAEVSVDKDKYKVKIIIMGFRYNIFELHKARLASANGQITTNLEGDRSMATQRAIAELSNKTGAYGSTKEGMVGFFNDPNVPVENSTFDPYDPGTTNNELVDWFTENTTRIMSGTNLVEEPNIALVTQKLFTRMNKRYPGDFASVRQSILESNPLIKNILPYNEGRFDQVEAFGLESSGTNKSYMTIFNLNPLSVNRKVSPLNILPAQLRDLEYRVIMYKAISSTMWHYPESGLIVKYPEDSVV